MTVRNSVFGGILITALLAGSSVVFADNANRLPAGHSYSPSEQRLPALNSRRDRINSRADIYESEIRRANRDAAVTFGDMRIFGHDQFLSGGSSNRPYIR